MDLDRVQRRLDSLQRFARGGRVKPEIEGTNCANCLYVQGTRREAIRPEDLNDQGGIVIPGEALQRAKKADLITLPGGGRPSTQLYCKHKDVQQFVNRRMCCIYWDAPGTYRQWEDGS